MDTLPLLLLLSAAIVSLPGCAADDRTTSPSLACDGCAVFELDAGEELAFEASWLGRAWDDGPLATEGTYDTCDPIRVEIRCEGASCETTRHSPNGAFWSLEQALGTEAEVDGSAPSCMVGTPESFAVRPTTGGDLTVTITMTNLRTEESMQREFGPFTVHPPTIEPAASCDGCDLYGRVGVGTPFTLHARWDGSAGADDPIGRQPFVLTVDCGDVACEARRGSSFDPDEPPWAPLEPWTIDAEPARRGVELQLRATEPGTMDVSARLEHVVTHESRLFELGSSSQHRVDSLRVLCLGGELCGYAPEFAPAAELGVIGLDGDTEVFVDANVKSSSDASPVPHTTSCSPAPHIASDGVEISVCETRLYAVDGATKLTLSAEWNGLGAELTVPEL